MNQLFCILQREGNARDSTSQSTSRELLYVPRVPPSVGDTAAVRATFLDMIKFMSASTGAEAESIVLRTWQNAVQSSAPSIQAALSVDAPSDKFWQDNLYTALSDVARRAGANLLVGNEFIPLGNFLQDESRDPDFWNTCFIAAVINLRFFDSCYFLCARSPESHSE